MPEITVIHIALLAIAAIVGVALGWFGRNGRAKQEKAAINDGWQDQLEAQRSEHTRLIDQNKSLMHQVQQMQASNTDNVNRARELSGALKEAFARRDELQREIKDIRGHLQTAIDERRKLETESRGNDGDSSAKDEKIRKLESELENWKDRLPPLIDRYRQRDEEANELETELLEARGRIAALEAILGSDETRVEAVDPDALRDGYEASNDPQPDEVDPHADDWVATAGFQHDDDAEGTFPSPGNVPEHDDDDIDEPDVAVDAQAEDDEPEADIEPEADEDEPVADVEAHAEDDEPDVEDEGTLPSPGNVPGDDGNVEVLADSDALAEFAEAHAEAANVEADSDDDTDEESAEAADDFDDESAEGTFPSAGNVPGDDLEAQNDDDAEADEEIDLRAQNDDDADAPFGHNGSDPVGGLRDNLKLIKGVGPAIEKTLNELGIFRFSQIAELSDYDIERVSRHLKGFSSRIEREDWIGQAQSLNEEKLASQA